MPQGKEGHRNTGMQLDIDTLQTTTNIPDCMTMHELQQVMSQDEQVQHIKEHITQGWLENRAQIPQNMRT